MPEQRAERRLWTIDLNDVRVVDEQGNEFAVLGTQGEMYGRLEVVVDSPLQSE